MQNKEQVDKTILVENIKKWLECDNKINEINKQAKEIKKQKKALSESLTELMKGNDLETIDTKHGQIQYIHKEVKKGVNQKYLTQILNQYYTNPVMAKEVCDYIMENRETQIRENIRLKKDKS
jgi:hypothetical protein